VEESAWAIFTIKQVIDKWREFNFEMHIEFADYRNV
jgi:hypothetical protein